MIPFLLCGICAAYVLWQTVWLVFLCVAKVVRRAMAAQLDMRVRVWCYQAQKTKVSMKISY